MDLAGRVRAGEPRALARAISIAEQESAGAAALIKQLHPHTGRAVVVGLTGPPGVGKSSLVDRLTTAWRNDGRRVAVLAVDPTSPFTGGALLGDRIRMQRHTSDAGVFVRSMATRGHLGGLAPATHDAVTVLDAAGFDVVAIETVGVGQGEVEVGRIADVSVVVTVPGTGDDVQAIKAGIMEIADVFVVNKSDRDGADRAAAELEAMLTLRAGDAVRPAVVRTCAASGEGLESLSAAIAAVSERTRDGTARTRTRVEARLEALVLRRMAEVLASTAAWPTAIARVQARDVDPYTAADDLVRAVSRELTRS